MGLDLLLRLTHVQLVAGDVVCGFERGQVNLVLVITVHGCILISLWVPLLLLWQLHILQSNCLVVFLHRVVGGACAAVGFLPGSLVTAMLVLGSSPFDDSNVVLEPEDRLLVIVEH